MKKRERAKGREERKKKNGKRSENIKKRKEKINHTYAPQYQQQKPNGQDGTDNHKNEALNSVILPLSSFVR